MKKERFMWTDLTSSSPSIVTRCFHQGHVATDRSACGCQMAVIFILSVVLSGCTWEVDTDQLIETLRKTDVRA